MADGILSKLNPVTYANSTWESIKKYANTNIFTLFTTVFAGVFIGSFLALFLINGAFMGMVEGIGTFCSYFFSGFILKAFGLSIKAFLGGVLTGLSSVIMMAPFILFGVINLAFLAALIYTGYTIWKNPSKLFSTVNAKDPSYNAIPSSNTSTNGINPNNIQGLGPQDPNNGNGNVPQVNQQQQSQTGFSQTEQPSWIQPMTEVVQGLIPGVFGQQGQQEHQNIGQQSQVYNAQGSQTNYQQQENYCNDNPGFGK